MLTDEEQDWLSMLHRDDEQAMQLICRANYNAMVTAAFNLTEQKDAAIELTNSVLMDFWQNRKKLTIQTGLRHYLKGEIVTACIAWLRYKYKMSYPEQIPEGFDVPKINDINFDFEVDSRSLIGKLIAGMPEKNKLVMRLSRHESYKIHEIAKKLKTTNQVIEFYIIQSLDIIRNGLVRFG